MVFFEPEKMATALKKIVYYKIQEQENINDIKASLSNVNSCINTGNKGMFDQARTTLQNKSNTVKTIHENNIRVINSRINKQIALQTKNKQILSGNGGMK